MRGLPISLVCAGCGTALPDVADEPYPFRCPAARPGDDIDHVVRRRVDPAVWSLPVQDDPNPFIRYRRRLYSWHVATAHGLGDAEFVALVRGLDEAVASVDGAGFQATPLLRADRLHAVLRVPGGSLWVKDETRNVSGSHKARHLMGVMIYLRVVDALRAAGHVGAEPASPRLAIASCGNAALGAAVVARAAGRPLDVFVPPWADPGTLTRLHALGASVTSCERRPGEAGDPCYLRFKEALAGGALPFCVQGPDNGLTIEGGETLIFELLDQASERQVEFDRIFVQVGGGALASACVQALLDAKAAGRIARLPRLHPVQTEGGYPLARAWDRLASRFERAHDVGEVVHLAATRRSQFMWPWETEPKSVAHGILDDETYDWLSVIEGAAASGGAPVVVSEHDLIRANDLARDTTGVNVDHTGSSGLAGYLRFLERRPGAGSHPGEQVAVFFTGATRQA